MITITITMIIIIIIIISSSSSSIRRGLEPERARGGELEPRGVPKHG